jgi:citrate synthase
MRGMTGMLYETSKLDAIQGINYREKDLFEIRESAPRAPEGTEPLPEGILWLLLTGDFPDENEIVDFQNELFKRGKLTADEEKLIRSFPANMHPMTQFSMGVMACQRGSKFAKAYRDGVHKSKYWETTLEDALDVVAKVHRIAALVFNNSYGKTKEICDPDPYLDYGANYSKMIGFEDKGFWDLMRLYITLHA